MNELETIAKELQSYTRVIGSHNKHINDVAGRLVELVNEPKLNSNQQNEIFDQLKKKQLQNLKIELTLQDISLLNMIKGSVMVLIGH